MLGVFVSFLLSQFSILRFVSKFLVIVSCFVLLVSGSLFLVSCFWLSVACSVVCGFGAHCSLVAIRCVVFGGRCLSLLLVGRCLLSVVCCSLSVVCCLLYVVRCT